MELTQKYSMSSSYCIIGVNKAKLIYFLSTDETFITEEANEGLLKISVQISGSSALKKYALKKRVWLAGATKQAPDDIQGGNKESVIFLDKNAPDEDNTHFIAYSESISHPEIILTGLVKLAQRNGFEDARFISEHDQEYQDMFFEENNDEINDGDLPE